MHGLIQLFKNISTFLECTQSIVMTQHNMNETQKPSKNIEEK